MKRVSFAALIVLCTVALSPVFAGQAGPSADKQTSAKNEVASPALDSTEYWSTEGSGYCATGNLTCSSGRQIGCNATGEWVRCQYTAGDVGWVRCDASGGGVTSAFEDQCP